MVIHAPIGLKGKKGGALNSEGVSRARFKRHSMRDSQSRTGYSSTLPQTPLRLRILITAHLTSETGSLRWPGAGGPRLWSATAARHARRGARPHR